MLCAARARGPSVIDYSTITPSLCMEIAADVAVIES